VHLKALIAATIVAKVYSHSFSSSGVASAINTFYRQNRFKGAFLTCSIKGCSADLVAQCIAAAKERDVGNKQQITDDNINNLLKRLKRIGNDPPVEETATKPISIDLRRSAIFLLYGGFYQGCAQEFIYNDLFPKAFGTGTDVKTVMQKVFVDMGIINTLLCIPMAYMIKGILDGHTFVESMQKYWDDIVNKGVLFKSWAIFVPVQCLTFSVIPEHFRVSFVAFVSFFWTVVLSSLLNG